MKKCLLLTIMWLSVAGGSALAKNSGVWSQGELTLMNGTQLEGQLNYNWKAEIVQIQVNNAVKAYSAFQVREFKFFDNSQSTIRKFVAVDLPVKHTLVRPLFLEEFVTGPLMVYRRLRHTKEPIKVNDPELFGTDEQLVKDVDNFNYFVFEGQDIIKLDEFSRSIWPRMQQEFSHELKQYASHLQMDITSTIARLMLINKYNYLKSETAERPIIESEVLSVGR